MLIAGPDLEGDFRGALRAEIIVLCVLLSRLIHKRDAELARSSERRHLPVRLLAPKFGQTELPLGYFSSRFSMACPEWFTTSMYIMGLA